MNTFIYAIGRVAGSERDILIIPSAPAENASDAYTIGEMDHDDNKPCDPLFHFCSLSAITDYICGYRAAEGAQPQKCDFAAPAFLGFLDFTEGKACEPLQYGYSTVAECEAYIVGFRDAVADAQPADGTLQKLIDYGAELQELQDGIADEDFWRHHC